MSSCHCNGWYCEDCNIRMCAGCVGEDDPRCPGCNWSPICGQREMSECYDEDGNWIEGEQ